MQDPYKPIPLESLPHYELFLSQVTDFLNEHFPSERVTGNIIQNYIKNEVISKPIHGKKRGYSRAHLIQLLFLFYMRPILSTEEIKQVFSLAFNEINETEDDLISWESAYEIFCRIYAYTSQERLSHLASFPLQSALGDLTIPSQHRQSLLNFIKVLILVTQASALKNEVLSILPEHEN